MEYLLLTPYVLIIFSLIWDFGDKNFFEKNLNGKDNIYRGLLCHKILDIRAYVSGSMVASIITSFFIILTGHKQNLIIWILAISIILYALLFIFIWKISVNFSYEDLYLEKKYFYCIKVKGRTYLTLLKFIAVFVAFSLDLAKILIAASKP